MIFKNILGVSNLYLWWTLLLIATAKDRPIQGESFETDASVTAVLDLLLLLMNDDCKEGW